MSSTSPMAAISDKSLDNALPIDAVQPVDIVTVQDDDFKPSPLRFLVAGLLCVSSALSGYILQTYVTIWFLAMDTYGVDSLAINMFSLVYAIFYIPGSMLSIALYARFGLSHCIVGGAFFNFLSAWVRTFGAFSTNMDSAYKVQLFGQIFAALGQPLLLNAPPRIANDWFPKSERDLAMHIMTQSNNIGGGFGAIIPVYQIVTGADIPYMLLWIGVAATGILVLSAFLVPYSPPIHAEYDAVHQDFLRSKVDVTSILGIYKQMLCDFYTMFQNRNFNLLFVSFSIQVGISWVFMAVVGQMIYPCGYGIDIVGGALSGMGFAGVFGSFLIAFILRRFHNHLMMQKIVTVLVAAACIWCLGVNTPGNTALIVASWIFYGFISGPLTPITLEHAAEITYPIPADNSAALLFTGVNLLFLAVTLGVTPMLTYDVSTMCSSIVSPSSALMLFFVIIGAFVVLPMTSDFKRAAVTVQAKEDVMEAGIASEMISKKEGSRDI